MFSFPLLTEQVCLALALASAGRLVKERVWVCESVGHSQILCKNVMMNDLTGDDLIYPEKKRIKLPEI